MSDPRPKDPCIPLVAAARVFRLSGHLDAAEFQMNAAAKVFRDLGVTNTSRAYRAEARQVAYARFIANERAEIAKAIADRLYPFDSDAPAGVESDDTTW